MMIEQPVDGSEFGRLKGMHVVSWEGEVKEQTRWRCDKATG
jgi:hypothetical protein